MGTRLFTSLQTKETFEDLGIKMNLRPFALAKLAVALSLTNEEPIEKYMETMDRGTMNSGLELHRQTITAQFDLFFKVLVEDHCERHLTEDEYFPDYIKLHIDRGAEMLKNKYRYATNMENFVLQILEGGNAL